MAMVKSFDDEWTKFHTFSKATLKKYMSGILISSVKGL